MKLLTVLVASSIINFQQPVPTHATNQGIDSKILEQVATDYLKIRFTDADFIQTTIIEQNNGHGFDVYLAFSADSTPINTCKIHLHTPAKQSIQLEEISCVNYQKKIGFKETIYSTVND